MINLHSLAEKYPINNKSETRFSQENDPNHSYFQQGRELGLLINTPEGARIIEEAKSMVVGIIEKNTQKHNLKMSYIERRDDMAAGSPREKEYEERQLVRQKEIERRASEILTGKIRMSNHEERTFIKLKDPEWNEDLSFNEDQKAQIELAHDFFHTYGMAIEYQSQENGLNLMHIPGKKDSAKNRIANGNILHQKAFNEGWKSAPKIIDLTPSG